MDENVHDLKHDLLENKMLRKILALNGRLNTLIQQQEHFAATTNETLGKILAQTTISNGRISTLEDKTTLWRWLSDSPARIILILFILQILGDFGFWLKLIDLIP